MNRTVNYSYDKVILLFRNFQLQQFNQFRVYDYAAVRKLSDEDARRLADRFEMTGGQISKVVAKRELAVLYYEGDRGYEYICELCRTETAEPVKGLPRKEGF